MNFPLSKENPNKFFLSVASTFFIFIAAIAFLLPRSYGMSVINLVPDLFIYSVAALLGNILVLGEEKTKNRAGRLLVLGIIFSGAIATIFVFAWSILGSLLYIPSHTYLPLGVFYPHCGHGCEFNIWELPSVQFAEGLVCLIPLFVVFSFGYCLIAQLFSGNKPDIKWKNFWAIIGFLIVGLSFSGLSLFLERLGGRIIFIFAQGFLLLPAIWYTTKLIDISNYKVISQWATFICVPVIVLNMFMISVIMIRALCADNSIFFRYTVYNNGGFTTFASLVNILLRTIHN